MSKSKILYGLEASGGGALKHLIYLVTKLNNKRFDITVILSNKRQENIDSEIWKMRYYGANVILMPIKRNIHIGDFIIIIKLFFHIRNHKYDIVHAHSSKAGSLFRIAAWLNNVPKIYYTPHCFYFQGKQGLKKWFFVVLEKMFGWITTGVIVSDGEKQEMLKYNLVPGKKIININNAIDFNEYNLCKEIKETKENLAIKDNDFIVGAIGRLAYQKDWKTYIYAANEVLKKYPNVVFLIIGTGELYSEIKKMIKDLHLEKKVSLTGYIKDIYKIYGIIDVYVNTSLWEGLPYVFLEAMKYKIPIVATDTGNETAILHEESGFISPIKDYKAIADKIIMLIENKKMAFQMGLKGNELLTEKYSFELFIQQHEMFYENITLNEK
jgi:glycosyltransferase involved in cell wall biosynthesis